MGVLDVKSHGTHVWYTYYASNSCDIIVSVSLLFVYN